MSDNLVHKIRSGERSLQDLFEEGISLDDLAVEDADLSDTAVSDSSMNRTSFKRCLLRRFDAFESRSEESEFVKCNLDDAGLAACDLARSRFIECDCRLTGFGGSVLEEALFQNTTLAGAVLGRTKLKRSTFLHSILKEVSLGDADAQGSFWRACLFQNMAIEEANFTGATLAGCRFEDTPLSECNFEKASFLNTDLSGMVIDLQHGPTSFQDAKYDQFTQFPEGFDPEAYGMHMVESEGPAERYDGGEPQVGAVDEEKSPAVPELKRVEGLFFQEEHSARLIEGPTLVGLALGKASWPPTGYQGAEPDLKHAQWLSERLHEFNELSSRHEPYFSLVLHDVKLEGEDSAMLARVAASLAEAEALLGPIDDASDNVDDEDDQEDEDAALHPFEQPELVMFQGWQDDVEPEEFEDNETWFEDWMDESEYEARLAVGEYMKTHFTDVEYFIHEIGEGWSLARYQGTSPSGAKVGVAAVRYNPDWTD